MLRYVMLVMLRYVMIRVKVISVFSPFSRRHGSFLRFVLRTALHGRQA